MSKTLLKMINYNFWPNYLFIAVPKTPMKARFDDLNSHFYGCVHLSSHRCFGKKTKIADCKNIGYNKKNEFCMLLNSSFGAF